MKLESYHYKCISRKEYEVIKLNQLLIYLQYLSAVESPNPDKGSDSGRCMAKYLSVKLLKNLYKDMIAFNLFPPVFI